MRVFPLFDWFNYGSLQIYPVKLKVLCHLGSPAYAGPPPSLAHPREMARTGVKPPPGTDCPMTVSYHWLPTLLSFAFRSLMFIEL